MALQWKASGSEPPSGHASCWPWGWCTIQLLILAGICATSDGKTDELFSCVTRAIAEPTRGAQNLPYDS